MGRPLQQCFAVASAHLLRFILTGVTLLLCLEGVSSEGWTAQVATSSDLSRADDIQNAEIIRNCYNDLYSATPTTFFDYMSGSPVQSMRIYRIWWSPRKPVLPLTVLTTTDLRRLYAVAAQCRSFPGGVLSVAAYLPLYEPSAQAAADLAQATSSTEQAQARRLHGNAEIPTDLSAENAAKLAEAAAELDAFFRELEESAPMEGDICSLRLMLMYETVGELPMTALFPVNVLRNAAMLVAGTPLVSMVDVDLDFNRGLVDDLLANVTRVAEMVRRGEDDHHIWVLPAWETGHNLTREQSDEIVERVMAMRSSDKPMLREMWLKDRLVLPFHADVYKKGHQTTDYDQWFRTSSDYRVEYQTGYEPWVIVARKAVPMFDPRYRGYGFNKISFLVHMASSGYTFNVQPDAWIVHRPHEATTTHDMHRGFPPSPPFQPGMTHAEPKPAGIMDLNVRLGKIVMKAREAFGRRNYAFFKASLDDMKKGVFKVSADEPALFCRGVLSWWQQHHR